MLIKVYNSLFCDKCLLLHLVTKDLENERKRYLSLEGTWKKANVQFVQIQDELRSEIKQLKDRYSIEEQS